MVDQLMCANIGAGNVGQAGDPVSLMHVKFMLKYFIKTCIVCFKAASAQAA